MSFVKDQIKIIEELGEAKDDSQLLNFMARVSLWRVIIANVTIRFLRGMREGIFINIFVVIFLAICWGTFFVGFTTLFCNFVEIRNINKIYIEFMRETHSSLSELLDKDKQLEERISILENKK